MLTREFRKLWLGQAVSAVGSSVTIVALPLTAALTLAATPEQIGLVVAAGWLPYLLIGVVFMVSGLASVAGATLVQRTTRHFGIGPSMVGSILLFTLAGVLILAASGPPVVATVYLAARGAIVSFCAAVFNVTSTSVWQAAVPDRLLGRVGGAGQVIGLGLIPICAVAGGWLGQHAGLWNTLAISVGGQFLAFSHVAVSPLRGVRRAGDLPALTNA